LAAGSQTLPVAKKQVPQTVAFLLSRGFNATITLTRNPKRAILHILRISISENREEKSMPQQNKYKTI
jgi:hypothetical protein